MAFTQVLLLIIVVVVVNQSTVMAKFTAVTYNTALIDSTISSKLLIPNNRIERRGQIIQMLRNTNADLICLQEVWLVEDVQAIVKGVRYDFPSSLSKLHDCYDDVSGSLVHGEGPVCNDKVLLSLFGCAQSAGCDGKPFNEDFITTTCVFAHCFAEYYTLLTASSEDCLTCFLTAIPDEAGILARCAGVGDHSNLKKMNTPGLLMLSKTNLQEAAYVDIFPTTKELLVRGYLTAKVKGLQIACTHLSADLQPYAEVFLNSVYWFSSYAEQNLFETNKLISTFGTLRQVLLLGDFNTGIAGPNRKIAKIEDSYQALSTVFNTSVINECTYCSLFENPYNAFTNNYIVDDFFQKGLNFQYVKRIYTQADGSVVYNATILPLSDHFGVEASFTRDEM